MTSNNIARALELARENLLNKKLINKQYYDKNAKDLEIQIDDLVLVKSQVKKHKFQDVYDGPFRVVDSSDAYIEIMKNGKRTKVHKNLIKKARAEYEKEPPTSTPVVSLDNLTIDNIQKLELIYNINF